MSGTIFKNVSYDLITLINYIGLNEIALPDNSAPFCVEKYKG